METVIRKQQWKRMSCSPFPIVSVEGKRLYHLQHVHHPWWFTGLLWKGEIHQFFSDTVFEVSLGGLYNRDVCSWVVVGKSFLLLQGIPWGQRSTSRIQLGSWESLSWKFVGWVHHQWRLTLIKFALIFGKFTRAKFRGFQILRLFDGLLATREYLPLDTAPGWIFAVTWVTKTRENPNQASTIDGMWKIKNPRSWRFSSRSWFRRPEVASRKSSTWRWKETWRCRRRRRWCWEAVFGWVFSDMGETWWVWVCGCKNWGWFGWLVE